MDCFKSLFGVCDNNETNTNTNTTTPTTPLLLDCCEVEDEQALVSAATRENCDETRTNPFGLYPGQRRSVLPAVEDLVFVPTAGNALQAIPRSTWLKLQKEEKEEETMKKQRQDVSCWVVRGQPTAIVGNSHPLTATTTPPIMARTVSPVPGEALITSDAPTAVLIDDLELQRNRTVIGTDELEGNHPSEHQQQHSFLQVNYCYGNSSHVPLPPPQEQAVPAVFTGQSMVLSMPDESRSEEATATRSSYRQSDLTISVPETPSLV